MTSRILIFLLTSVTVLLRLAVYALIAIPMGGLASAACGYDCVWYVRLAAEGYASHGDWEPVGPVPNWAFFPLFPLLIRTVMATGISAAVAGLVVANAVLVGFVMLGAAWLQRTRTAHDSRLWVLFALLFPFGFIFSVPYTEGLFGALMVAALLAMADGRRLLAGCAIALMCATRPNGVVMLPLLAVACFRALYLGWPLATSRLALLGETMLPLSVAPLGLSAWMAYQYGMIGDALAFSHVQILWDRAWIGPVAQLNLAFQAWDWDRVIAITGPASASYNATWSVLGLAVAVWLGWQRRWSEAYILGVCILLPLSSGIHSMPRFVATNPAFLFACFDLVRRIRHRSALAALGTAFAMAQSVLIFGWYHSANALF